ncbi:hypothetical protein ACFWIA_21095 [Streptomyces sp. NPDC127068]|uniref:hypothetical protein n=1 Tax=Streptomyces sp. NPDC127068 TaxID=3347127 RepID=UPI003650D1EA
MRMKTLGGGLLLGAAAVLFAAGPAAAGTDVYVNTTDPFNGGAAGFAHNGDVFTVCDNRSDGLRASGHIGWQTPEMSYWIPLEDANGSGNPCARSDPEIPEGKRVTVQICLKDGAAGTPRYCATEHGTA